MILPGIPFSADVVVGAYGVRAFPQALKWRMLVRGSFPAADVALALIEPTWTPNKRRDVEAAMPPSERAGLHLLDDAGWSSILEYPEAFIAIPGRYLRRGGPTDAGWDEFEEVYAST